MYQRLAALASLTVFVSGCALTAGQKVAVARFNTATQEFTELASKEFANSRADVIEMNRMKRRLDAMINSTPDLSAGELDGAFTVERVQVRQGALAALAEYGQLLDTLATSSNTAEIREAAQSFVGALKDVGSLAIDESKAQLLESIVERVGSILVESMRRRAVIEVVEFANPYVLELTRLVEQSFDPRGEHWSLEYDKTVLGVDTRAKAATNIVKPAPASSDVATTPSVDRGVLASIQEASDFAESCKSRFHAISLEIISSCDKLRDAQSDLRAALRDDTISSEGIQGYLEQVHDFVSMYRTLRSTGN